MIEENQHFQEKKDTKFRKGKLRDWPFAHPEVLKGFCGVLVNWLNHYIIKSESPQNASKW